MSSRTKPNRGSRPRGRNPRKGGGKGNPNARRGGRSGGPTPYTKKKAPPKKKTLLEKILGFFGLGGDKKKKPAAAKTNAAAKPKNNNGNKRPGGNTSNGSSDGRSRRTPELVDVTTPRLYVGNLSYDANEEHLMDLFRGVGSPQLAEVVSHRYTQRSKGYAFVEMSSVDEAKRAVDVLHDKEFMGRNLVVSGAKSPGVRSSGDSSEEEVE